MAYAEEYLHPPGEGGRGIIEVYILLG